METAKINGEELEYEVAGAGEPVLLIPTGPIADSFWPFFASDALAKRHQLVIYHQRGQAGSTAQPPVSFSQHAADAAALLRYLGIGAAHIAGHSTGGVTALQLAIDYPDMVHTLALLEPPLLSVPEAPAFLEKLGPHIEAYVQGRSDEAIAGFISIVCSLEWQACSRLFDKNTPRGVEQVYRDADNLFRSVLPALGEWQFGPEQAAKINQPALSVLGTESDQLFKESDEMLRAWLPHFEDCSIPRVAHLLHLQNPQPTIRLVSAFFARHPMTRAGPSIAGPRIATPASG